MNAQSPMNAPFLSILEVNQRVNNISNEIKNKIHELETTHNIRVLLACESGSRAWGFPSPDSDYDVRFIYFHPKEWYLSINEQRDVIELPVNKVLDINGWDLKKSLKLLTKNNSVLFEWIQSPILYSMNLEFYKEFKELCRLCFSPIAAMHHYLSCSKKHYEECIDGENVKLKKYFYCLRTTLAGLWIANDKTIPPMELQKLLSLIQDKQLLEKIMMLLHLKISQDESYLHPLEPDLDSFLKDSIAFCESIAPSLPKSAPDYEKINIFFRSTIEG